MKKYFLIIYLILVALSACQKDDSDLENYINYFEDDFSSVINWVLNSDDPNSSVTINNSHLILKAYQGVGTTNVSATRDIAKNNSLEITQFRIKLNGVKYGRSAFGSNTLRVVMNNIDFSIEFSGSNIPVDFEGDIEIVYQDFGFKVYLNKIEYDCKLTEIKTNIPDSYFEHNLIIFNSRAGGADNYHHAYFSIDYIQIKVVYGDSNNYTNLLPLCEIHQYSSNSSLKIGDLVAFRVTAKSDYNSINSIDIYFDEEIIYPAVYDWWDGKHFFYSTKNIGSGSHTIKAITKDSNGEVATDSFTINLSEDDEKEYLIDSRDGNKYEIVEIGTQTWMAENLRYNTGGENWLFNNDSNAIIFGRLYNWETAKEACPDGWHLPSDEEWKTLEKYLGMSQEDADKLNRYDRGTTEGDKLKATHGWKDDGGGMDAIDFSALPAGEGSGEIFNALGCYTYFWTSTESNEYPIGNIYVRVLSFHEQIIMRKNPSKSSGYSVRCVKN